MKIAAVVVTFNRLELLKHGIESLKQQSREIDEIIVVNNGSTDGTAEWLSGVGGISVITQQNVGGSGGFYTGIKAAYDGGADWIWCMDDDVFPRRDCLEHLVGHAGEPGIGIIAPCRLLDGSIFTHEFRKFNFTNPLASMHGSRLSQDEIKHHHDDNPESTIPIVGCDFEGPFISRQVVGKIGLPNKDLFIFCDDTDYCLRAHLAGFRLGYATDALMDKHKFFSHDTWTSRQQKKKWKRFYQVRNEAYLNHHYGLTWGVRYVRSWIGVAGYVVPAVLSMPFTRAWQWADIGMLRRAYSDGINERLGKREQ